MKKKILPLLFLASISSSFCFGQHSVARLWNEVMLDAIRNDFARPTVHARNLFHVSVAMYDAWAIYDNVATPYIIGRMNNGFLSQFDGVAVPADIQAAREEAISYAAFRLLTYRFASSPGQPQTQIRFNELMDDLGYDRSFSNTDYTTGNPAALGNFIAQTMIGYGQLDNSNEQDDYQNRYYEPVNEPMNLQNYQPTPDIDPNRWQPLQFEQFVDQSGQVIPGSTPKFLSPEWGMVHPFAFTGWDREVFERNDDEYWVYQNPGPPPYLNQQELTAESEAYIWGYSLVSIWSSHLTSNDGVMIDISPASIGNNPGLPEDYSTYDQFYNYLAGGDASMGHAVNPVTGEAYAPQIVPRGDYARVLAEFWADGPDSETPPGHWFTILNYVSDHELLEKRFKGEGEILDDLSWDVKSYFVLGGTMHDAAVASWGVKGWYDYARPISAIRYMAEKGQSTDPELDNYHIEGLPLVEGYIEVIEEGDPLAGTNNQNVGGIKLYAWRGHDFILDTDTDQAGVGWILAEDWWPYQRISFVTPPFAGYVSGHSTFSRAAAEVMGLLTGSEYFPGGMGEFHAGQNEFLVFEEGPSVDMTLQWATYVDASDQTSLSRIWGGIHPPADDIPGRKMGIAIGHRAFEYASGYIDGTNVLSADLVAEAPLRIYPNPVIADKILHVNGIKVSGELTIYNLQGKAVLSREVEALTNQLELRLDDLGPGVYMLKLDDHSQRFIIK